VRTALYRAMFLDGPVDADDAALGIETFEQCITAAQRCIDGGRFDVTDAVSAATQLWALLHGIVSLQLSHLLPPDQALACLTDGGHNLFRAFGDDPRALGRSFARGRERILATIQ
jgi:hypothetical protein